MRIRPVQTPDFDWDEFNIEHIAEHGVTPTEAEDAILDPDRVPSESRNTPTEKRQGLIGMTENGRILFVSMTLRRGAVRVVTAYEASERQKRQYRRGRR
jgi:uncharacterized DUF497 family protein